VCVFPCGAGAAGQGLQAWWHCQLMLCSSAPHPLSLTPQLSRPPPLPPPRYLDFLDATGTMFTMARLINDNVPSEF
jgi:hypothetical protein